MTPNEASEMIGVATAVSVTSILLVAGAAERKIKRIIANAAPANVITGCTFYAAKPGEGGHLFNTEWKKDV